MRRSHSFQHRPNSRNSRLQPFALGRVVVSCACGMEIAGTALERLEELDDTIFAALDGDAEALDRSVELWSDARRDLAAPLLSESRANIARHAKSVWKAYRDNRSESPTRAFAALEVMDLVADR